MRVSVEAVSDRRGGEGGEGGREGGKKGRRREEGKEEEKERREKRGVLVIDCWEEGGGEEEVGSL